MKVKALVDILLTHDPEATLLVEGYENGFDEIKSITKKMVTKINSPEDYDGQYRERKDLPSGGFSEDGAKNYLDSDFVEVVCIIGDRR